MDSEISYKEALAQWQDLMKLGWGAYWKPNEEPKWAVPLTKAYAASWREVAYQRIARAFLAHIESSGRKA